ncbi:MAG: chromosome partitioning protein ParB [Rhodobacterales bacterium]|nr:MAG: chromosome partitioning protein ParB [Rhodobacterales bacterium]
MTIQRIPLYKIIVADRLRSVDEDWAQAIAASIEQNGLMEPLVVRPLKKGMFALVAGAHRHRGLEIAGLTECDCSVMELTKAEARLAEIDENLMRRELSALDRAVFLSDRKRVYEELHPETKKGGDRKSDEAKIKTQTLRFDTFTEDVAEKVGLSQRTIQDAVALVKNLDPSAIEVLRDSPIASNGAQLKALSKLSADQQRDAAPKLADGTHGSVKDYRISSGELPVSCEPTNPRDVWMKKQLSHWAEGKKAWREAFLKEIGAA